LISSHNEFYALHERPEREPDLYSPCSAGVKNAWIYTSTPPNVFMAWDLFKHSDKFTLPAHACICTYIHTYIHTYIMHARTHREQVDVTVTSRVLFGRIRFESRPGHLLSCYVKCGTNCFSCE